MHWRGYVSKGTGRVAAISYGNLPGTEDTCVPQDEVVDLVRL